MELRPVPSFYAVYLLRSRNHPSSLYIGSTPNPRRRLRQHNGKGGAARTSRWKPWDMVCLVHGFPSSVAALQFEWTWQNPHLTRRIPTEDRITRIRPPEKDYTKSGQPRKRVRRPPLQMKSSLTNLNLLMRVPSFARWPLQVRFFNDNVYNVWVQDVTKGVEEVPAVLDLDPGQPDENEETEAAKAIADTAKSPPKQKRRKKNDEALLASAAVNIVNQGGVQGLDISYAHLRPALEKAQFFHTDDDLVKCAVCFESIQEQEFSFALLCPKDGCRTMSHMTCLAQDFLGREAESSTKEPQCIIPTRGECPSCGEQLKWIDLVSVASLRTRAPEKIDKIVNIHKNAKSHQATKSDWRTQLVVLDSEEDHDSSEPDVRIFDHEDSNVEDENGMDELEEETLRPEDVIDEDFLIEEDAESIASVVASADRWVTPKQSAKSRPLFQMPRAPDVIIDDSEDEKTPTGH